jgi:hypothetical protein
MFHVIIYQIYTVKMNQIVYQLKSHFGEFHQYCWQGQPNTVDQAAQIAIKDKVVEITDFIHRDEWKRFCEKVSNNKVTVIVWQLPKTWSRPSNIHVIQTHEHTWREIKAMQSCLKSKWNRQVDKSWKDFSIFCLYPDPFRMWRIAYLDALGLLDNAVYSTPNFDKEEWPYDTDQSDKILPRKYKLKLADKQDRLEHYHRQLKSKKDCDLETIGGIIKLLRQVHFQVSLHNHPDESEGFGYNITEKVLWPTFAQIPEVIIASPGALEQLAEWDFKPGWPVGDLSPRQQMAEITRLVHQNRNLDWAQRWQDSQGPFISHNYKILNELPARLEQDLNDQITRLPA